MTEITACAYEGVSPENLLLELCQKVAATPARGVGGGVGQSRDVPGGAKCATQTIRYREELLNNSEPHAPRSTDGF